MDAWRTRENKTREKEAVVRRNQLATFLPPPNDIRILRSFGCTWRARPHHLYFYRPRFHLLPWRVQEHRGRNRNRFSTRGNFPTRDFFFSRVRDPNNRRTHVGWVAQRDLWSWNETIARNRIIYLFSFLLLLLLFVASLNKINWNSKDVC